MRVRTDLYKTMRKVSLRLEKNMKEVSLNRVVGRIKYEIVQKAKKGDGYISSVDVWGVMRSKIRGCARGAAVTRAFSELVAAGVLTKTENTVYNPRTHHRVGIYLLN